MVQPALGLAGVEGGHLQLLPGPCVEPKAWVSLVHWQTYNTVMGMGFVEGASKRKRETLSMYI